MLHQKQWKMLSLFQIQARYTKGLCHDFTCRFSFLSARFVLRQGALLTDSFVPRREDMALLCSSSITSIITVAFMYSVLAKSQCFTNLTLKQVESLMCHGQLLRMDGQESMTRQSDPTPAKISSVRGRVESNLQLHGNSETGSLFNKPVCITCSSREKCKPDALPNCVF